MRPVAALALASLILATGCSREDKHPFAGFRDLPELQSISYQVDVSQTRVARGLGSVKKLISSVSLFVEEETTGEDTYALIVRSAGATGEDSQRIAAQRLQGRRLAVDLADGMVGGISEVFSGTQDLAAADIGLLFVLFAPVIPSPRVDTGTHWRVAPSPLTVPWSQSPLAFTIDHEAIGDETFSRLKTARVKSVALANVRFRLPLVVPASPRAGGSSADTKGSNDLIVNQLFEQLFADIDDPIEGFAAAIVAIPLAVAAPFLAIGEAIGSIFGSSETPESSVPLPPVVDLAGPLELRSDTQVWTADGRVLDALGNGKLTLIGTVPSLPGGASELSGKTLTLDIVWKLHRTHGKPLPAPREEPGRGPVPIVAVIVTLLAIVLAQWRMPLLRRKR